MDFCPTEGVAAPSSIPYPALMVADGYWAPDEDEIDSIRFDPIRSGKNAGKAYPILESRVNLRCRNLRKCNFNIDMV